MNFIYVVHLMCWNYLIALISMVTHSRNRNNSGDGNKKGGRALYEGDQGVPAYQVDDTA